MQLDPPRPPTALRERLSGAALALLLVPGAAAAIDVPASPPAAPPNQFDVTTLYYSEQGRTTVYEPVAHAMHLFADGGSVSGDLTFDAITGASPSGAVPSGKVQTITSASGRVRTVQAGEIPTFQFQDRRFALDGAWQQPLGRFVTSTVDAHASREKDYQSLGVDAKLSAELLQRLVTVSVGGGFSADSVFPVGGTPLGLSDGTVVSNAANDKRVSHLLLGVSQVLTRRWMVALDATRTYETGYLTEPYKVVSVLDPVTGYPLDQLTDKRPTSRTRDSLLLSSVYHLTSDVLYASYRYYRDDWQVRSHTLDLKYRHDDVEGDWYLEPHVRLYRQSAASFYTGALLAGAPLPDFATADYRLGQLTTITLGSTFAFNPGEDPGQWTLRAEYIRQAGDSSPPNAVGVQRTFDLAPPINTISLVVGYSF